MKDVAALAELGFYKGKHYSEYVDEVHLLIKENKLGDAEKLLSELVRATESEARQNNCGVAPWYYEKLAAIYRRRKDAESEIQILEKFSSQKHAPGVTPSKLLARLEKLKAH